MSSPTLFSISHSKLFSCTDFYFFFSHQPAPAPPSEDGHPIFRPIWSEISMPADYPASETGQQVFRTNTSITLNLNSTKLFISERGNQYDGRVIYFQSQDSHYPRQGTVTVEITATFTDEKMLSTLALAKMVRNQDDENREEGFGLYQSSGNRWFKDTHFLDLVVEVIYPKVLNEKEKLGKVEVQVGSSDFELKMLDSPFDSLKVNTARGKIDIHSVSQQIDFLEF